MLDLISSTPLVRILVLLAVFAAVVAVAMAILTLVGRRITLRGKLRAIAARGGSTGGAEQTLRQTSASAWTKLVERIEASGISLTDTKGDALREQLRLAGFDSPLAPRIYTLLRLVLVIVLPSAYVLLTLASGGIISFIQLYLVGSLLALLGLYVPNLFIRYRAGRLSKALTNGFPDCLDLLLICVEAGLGLESALDRVSREMAISHPEVSSLLATATLRLRAGATREEALRRLADDAAITEIRSFSTLLIQSDKLGTSIGETLRVYAAEMRERRRMRAEEKAHRLPVLISIPLVACMLPTMIGVLMLPVVIRVVRQIMPAMMN
jgi:tight adherence protein C